MESYLHQDSFRYLGVGNLLVTCGTFQIGSLAGNPMSSNKVLTPYLMPCKVDGIGTSIRRDSIDHREIFQWRNYVWDRSTNIPRLLRSFWGGWTLCTARNYWECWPVASRVRLAPTKTQNGGKTYDFRRSLLYRPGGGPIVCPIWYRVSCPPLGVEPNFSRALYRSTQIRQKFNGHLRVYSILL